MARILLLLLVWILRHTLGDIEQRFEQSDFRGRGGGVFDLYPGASDTHTRNLPGYMILKW